MSTTVLKESVPKIFCQLVTFHTKYKQRGCPCVHVLCSSKSCETYLLMYSELKNSFVKAGFHSVRPRSLNVDFELGMLNAIRVNYPNFAIHGCYFHFCQAVYRKLSELGLAPAFLSNKAFHIWTKKILACPYLPLTDMEDYFAEHFLQYLCNDDELRALSQAIDQLADYVTKTPHSTAYLEHLWSGRKRQNQQLLWMLARQVE